MSRALNLLLLAAIGLCLWLLYYLQPDPREPSLELVPERQMARSPAFGAFSANPNFPDGLTLRQPVAGTIPRGKESFAYGPTPAEAARAGKELQNPLAAGHPQAPQQGAALYATYCQYCHGRTGMGDGPVSGRGFPAPLSFLKPQAMEMKDGEMFHILTHGKGNMPAQAVQLAPPERWAVILHVRVLQNQYNEFPKVSLPETAAAYKANCLACHGEDGAGHLLRGKFPNLPDFSSLAWQFSKTNLEITNRIEYGDEPLMPSFRYKLTRDQILGLSIYLRSFAIKDGGPAAKAPPPVSAAGMTPVQIFRAFCLACHNVDGKGAIVRPGMPDIPDFTLASWQAGKKDEELGKSILSGGKFMPSMKDKLSAVDADRMVKFVRAFRDGKQVVELESQEVPSPPEFVPHPLLGASTVGLLGSPTGDGPYLAASALFPQRPELRDVAKAQDKKGLGKEKSGVMSADLAKRLRTASVLYREYCIACHGPDGTGVAAMRAVLPPLPDFTKPLFQEQHSDPQLLVSILDGKGTLMPANRGRVNEAQARDLVAYIRAFGPAGVVPPAPNDIQLQFEELIRQWEALEKEIRALKKTPSK
jgi:mono/diheme cytochrome c family protein